ncbi:ISAs1 family transposase [Streptomyces hokutonensis]|uniref:ISAs1 family transposase n=1 Tax=Streptomyces hokutonensis TaxID=1306990 RepID=A0ABW6M5G0_9ACTN
MTDAEWAEVRAAMPVLAWLLKRGGRPEELAHREILDAVRYLVDNGVKWMALPVDFPYWRAVYDFFRRWRAYDYVREPYERLRHSARERAGRNAEPGAGIIDSQSVDASETVGEDSRGYDGGKPRDGRKRHILRAVPADARCGLRRDTVRRPAPVPDDRAPPLPRRTARPRHLCGAPVADVHGRRRGQSPLDEDRPGPVGPRGTARTHRAGRQRRCRGACAVLSGAWTITEITEWGQRATTTVLGHLGIRRHPPGHRRAPSHTTLTRFLAVLDGDALDTVIGTCLAERDPRTAVGSIGSAPRPAIAVVGKALSGSTHRTQRRRHLLSTVTHAPTVTLAQREVGAKTNETVAFRPLLELLDPAGAVVTFDALHSVKDQVRRLVQEKKAHYIAVIKGNQPTASAQVRTLPWEQVPVAHTVSRAGHGRRESRSVKTLATAANLGGIAFAKTRPALRIHPRRQKSGRQQTRETVYAVTSLDTHQASPADLGGYVRGHWGIENSSHHVRDVVFAEDASTVHTANAPRAMAALRNLAIGRLRLLGADNIAKTTRAIRDVPEHALWIWGITDSPLLPGT